ncbi:hypothetical protein X762_10715 [Mesorhizobium sp. LSHC426A00]|nr:hypothetical protein X768_28425 [Mesorhizobium sp. LSJC265A00]ESX49382.1 hypothetical protein X762_10715 [Mesorhizobium sp. LSHC426A00]ESX72326.1 hypothetical protein X758_13345 [Mesorhizobium sp. LSHC416B00]
MGQCEVNAAAKIGKYLRQLSYLHIYGAPIWQTTPATVPDSVDIVVPRMLMNTAHPWWQVELPGVMGIWLTLIWLRDIDTPDGLPPKD